MHRLPVLAALAWIPALASAADAPPAPQPPPDPAPGHALVVTATRGERSAEGLPAAVSVVTAEEVALSPALNVDDLLRHEPAVDHKRVLGPAEAIPANFTLRGVPGPNRALILIDGIPANGAGTGFTSFNEVPLMGVERIEVVRGPFSALYGANAFGGVVNVITADGAGPFSAALRGGLGNEGFGRAGGSAGGSAGAWSFAGTASTLTMDNYRSRDTELERTPVFAGPGPFGSFRGFWDAEVPVENRDYRHYRAHGKATWHGPKGSGLVLQGRWFERETGLGKTDRLPVQRDQESADERAAAGATWRMPLGDALTWELSAHWRRGDELLSTQTQFLLPSVTPPFFLDAAYAFTEARTVAEEVQAATRVSWDAGDHQRLTAGVDVLTNRARFGHIYLEGTRIPIPDAWSTADLVEALTGSGTPIVGSADVTERITTAGVYIQDEIDLGPVTLVPGLRYDRSSQAGGFLSPRLAAAWRVVASLDLRASAGRAFRAPSLSELYKPEWSQTANVRLRPNPALEPETIWAFDAGVAWRPHTSVAIGLDGFQNEMHDLIGTGVDLQLLTNTGTVLFNRYHNTDRARSYGGTASLSWRPAQRWAVEGSVTRQRGENLTDGTELDHFPTWKAAATLHGGIAVGAWEHDLGLTQAWVGSRSYTPYGPPGTPACRLDPYFRTDAHLRATWRGTWWVGGSVQNLFDTDYEESGGTYATGRMLLVEAGASF